MIPRRRSASLACLVVFIPIMLGFSRSPAAMDRKGPGQPRGRLFIIGGGDRPEAMMQRFVDLASAFGTGKIVVFTMASSAPQETGPGLVEEFKKLGAGAAEYHHLTREQALAPESVRLLDGAGGVYFSGGDQARHMAVLLDTPLHLALLDLYGRGAVIGGSSAGAAVMSEVMITGDEKRKPEEGHEFETLETGNVITSRGLGFITTAIVDQHFARRKRYNRILSLLAEHPELLGIAIDESTAVLVHPDRTFEVIGERSVLVFDPLRARVRHLPGNKFNIAGLVLHILTQGQRFDLRGRKVLN